MPTNSLGLDASVVAREITLGENTADDITGVTEDLKIRGSGYSTFQYDGQGLWVEDAANPSYDRKTLLRFDLSAIPNERIVGAQIELWVNYAGVYGGPKNWAIWSCDREWVEATATWATYDGTNAWGASHDADINLGTVAVPGSEGDDSWFIVSPSGLVSYLQDVQAGLDGAPTGEANIIIRASGNDSPWAMYDSENASLIKRPKLRLWLENPKIGVGLDAAIKSTLTKSVGLDGSVGHYGRYADVDAAVKSTLTKSVGLDGSLNVYGKYTDLDASIVEPTARVTQAPRQIMAQGNKIKVTQAPRQIMAQGNKINVTQVVRQVMYTQEEPSTPSIISVTNIQGNTADVTSSAYYHPGLDAHDGTRYQVQLAGGDWSAIVYDTGVLGAVTSGSLAGMVPLFHYQVRVAYVDDEGDWSDWSFPYYFQTTLTILPGNFDFDDWAQMWNVGDSMYHNGYKGPGGWTGPIDWTYFGTYDPAPNPGDQCYGVGEVSASGYNGNVGSFGRLFGPPSTLVNKVLGANRGVNVAAKLSWYSGQAGFSWERWWDCEFARHGVAALVCGTAEPTDPQMAWNVWLPFGYGSWQQTDDWQGVVAYIEPLFSWPYTPCFCCPPGSLVEWANEILMTCYHYGIALGAHLKVDVHFEGQIVQSYQYELPWKVAFSQTWPVCRNCTGFGASAWSCRHFPWYGIRLKVEKDYATDPEGKTHKIQAAVTTPPTTYHAGNDDYINIRIEGEWGVGEATLPPEDGPWDIDEVWVGGHDESGPDEGDGGLYCGWTGYFSDRITGGSPYNMSGGNIYKDFVALVLDSSHCDTPCDAEPRTPVNDIPPPTLLKPFPALQPCPPDADTAANELYLGGHGSQAALYKFGGYEVEEGRQLIAQIRPNPIAPMGYGGECLFNKIVVALEHFSDVQVSIVPILNGERLDQYAQEEVFIGPGDRPQLRRYEVPLYRAYEDAVVEGTENDRFKYGLRGAFFTFEMTIVDLCGVGLQFPGVWLEYTPLREAQGTGVVYTEDLLRTPAFTATGQVFMGTKGYNRLLKAASGTTDDGEQIEARVFTNPVSPEGAAGECAFRRVSLVVTRWNTNDMMMKVTPYIDGSDWPPIEIDYKATTAPVTEITELDLATYYRRLGSDAIERFRYRERGAWFHMKIETGSGLQEWLSIDGADLEYDVVREDLQKDVR